MMSAISLWSVRETKSPWSFALVCGLLVLSHVPRFLVKRYTTSIVFDSHRFRLGMANVGCLGLGAAMTWMASARFSWLNALPAFLTYLVFSFALIRAPRK